MHLTIRTVFYQYSLTGAISGVLVCPCALAALQYHSIVADVHIAALDQNIGTEVYINSIRRGGTTLRVANPHILSRRIDVTVQIAHMVAL